MQGYLPQLRENGFARPLIACDLTDVADLTLIGWEDTFLASSDNNSSSNDNFAPHNLVEDAKGILGVDFRSTAFSQVRQWK